MGKSSLSLGKPDEEGDEEEPQEGETDETEGPTEGEMVTPRNPKKEPKHPLKETVST